MNYAEVEERMDEQLLHEFGCCASALVGRTVKLWIDSESDLYGAMVLFATIRGAQGLEKVGKRKEGLLLLYLDLPVILAEGTTVEAGKIERGYVEAEPRWIMYYFSKKKWVMSFKDDPITLELEKLEVL